MSSLQQLENERSEVLENIAACTEYLALEPGDEDSIQLKKDLEQQLGDLAEKIAAEKAKNDAPPPPAAADVGRVEDGAQASFNVKDVVMAKYSADKQWYQATIVTRTGSSTDPVYTVTFKGYGNTETKRKHEIRGIDSKKRKAEGPPPVSENPVSVKLTPQTRATVTYSGASSVDPSLVQKREPSKVSDGPTREAPKPKKLKGSKALDKVQNNWQAWQKNGPKKTFGATVPKKAKESQFRTSEKDSINSQFINPQPKPQNMRSKYQYEDAGEDED